MMVEWLLRREGNACWYFSDSWWQQINSLKSHLFRVLFGSVPRPRVHCADPIRSYRSVAPNQGWAHGQCRGFWECGILGQCRRGEGKLLPANGQFPVRSLLWDFALPGIHLPTGLEWVQLCPQPGHLAEGGQGSDWSWMRPQCFQCWETHLGLMRCPTWLWLHYRPSGAEHGLVILRGSPGCLVQGGLYHPAVDRGQELQQSFNWRRRQGEGLHLWLQLGVGLISSIFLQFLLLPQLETRLPEEWLADSELWNHSNFVSTDFERSRWHSGNGFIHRLPLLSGQQGDGCLSIGASDRSFRPEDQFAAQQAAGAGGRHFGAVQFGPRTELHWRRPDHLHPVPGPVWPDAGSHHRQAGCHVNQQCSDETLGHPVAWYYVLGRLGLNGWLIQIGHDQREAKWEWCYGHCFALRRLHLDVVGPPTCHRAHCTDATDRSLLRRDDRRDGWMCFVLHELLDFIGPLIDCHWCCLVDGQAHPWHWAVAGCSCSRLWCRGATQQVPQERPRA